MNVAQVAQGESGIVVWVNRDSGDYLYFYMIATRNTAIVPIENMVNALVAHKLSCLFDMYIKGPNFRELRGGYIRQSSNEYWFWVKRNE